MKAESVILYPLTRDEERWVKLLPWRLIQVVAGTTAFCWWWICNLVDWIENLVPLIEYGSQG